MMLPERLPLSFSLLNHTIPLLILTAQPEPLQTPRPSSLLLLPEESRWELSGSVRKFLRGRRWTIHPSDEWTQRKTAEQGRRGKNIQVRSAVSASAERQHCAALVSALASAGGRVA